MTSPSLSALDTIHMSMTSKVIAPILHSLIYIHRLLNSIQVKIWHSKVNMTKIKLQVFLLKPDLLHYPLSKLMTTSLFRAQAANPTVILDSALSLLSHIQQFKKVSGPSFKIDPCYSLKVLHMPWGLYYSVCLKQSFPRNLHS